MTLIASVSMPGRPSGNLGWVQGRAQPQALKEKKLVGRRKRPPHKSGYG